MTGAQPEGWVRDLWEQLRPKARAQIRVIATALSGIGDATITPEVRDEARWAAQRLSGSLATYGFPDGAEAADRLAGLLEGEGELDLTECLQLLARLNAVVADPAPE